MLEVGIRELKSRLSYFVQLMQAGETIAIKVRDHVVGFLTQNQPLPPRKGKSSRDLRKKIESLKNEGFILHVGKGRLKRFQPIEFKGNLRSQDLIRRMRDEEG